MILVGLRHQLGCIPSRGWGWGYKSVSLLFIAFLTTCHPGHAGSIVHVPLASLDRSV